MTTYTISKTPQSTLNRLSAMARTARQPASPRVSTRDAAMRDAQTRDAYERIRTTDTLRTMNLRNARFWDNAGERELMAGLHSEQPPGPGPGMQYGAGNSMHQRGSTEMAASTPFDPVADLDRRNSGAPGKDMPACSQNAINHWYWKLPQEKRADFAAGVSQAHASGHDVESGWHCENRGNVRVRGDGATDGPEPDWLAPSAPAPEGTDSM